MYSNLSQKLFEIQIFICNVTQKPMINQKMEKILVWDTTQPMFVYKEVPVLSFIEYMVYLGGLVGLWFGTSAKDLVIILFDEIFWLNLWHKILIIYKKK